MDLSVLNDKQLAAVTAPRGPVLVLAGAGSGKTRVLAFRIAYIIEQGWYRPENVLAITFTNKAAKEMQSRVTKLLAQPKLEARIKNQAKQKTTNYQLPTASLPTLGTFHSVGARLLRKEITRLGYGPGFVITDSDDQLKILRELLTSRNLGKKFPPTLFRAYISSAKNALQTPSEFNLGLDPRLHELVQGVYVDYQDFLFKQNSVDFDDLLMLPIKIFQVFPEVLKKYQELFQYLLVDEYQDTNQAQYVFLQLLAQHRDLFVVGDDAQSIYGFRGSTIANILNFENDFPDAQIYKLEQNYRSSKHILAIAQKIIELNREQKPKTLWTANPTGPKVSLRELPDGRAEAAFVAEQIIKSTTDREDSEDFEYDTSEIEPEPASILDHFLRRQRLQRRSPVRQLPAEHAPLDRYAVLYRTHAQSRELEEVFIEAGIPYQIVGGVKFYERKEIKDVLAYLRLVMNFRDLVSLKRVLNEPPRGLGPKSYDTIKRLVFLSSESKTGLAEFINSIQTTSLSPKQKSSAQQFFGLLQQAQGLSNEARLTDLMKLVLKLTKLADWLRDGTEIGETRVENVHELVNVAAKFDHLSWHEGLEAFLEEVALLTDIDTLEDTKDAVTLMTLHAAKGLEFDTVFFTGLEEGLLPHSQSLLDPSELAEEIRLAYVGVTRARKQLFLLYARARQIYGSFQATIPSRILSTLPSEAVSGEIPTSGLAASGGELLYDAIDE